MQQQSPVEDEISWLLLEFTLEYPFPPTLGLAQKKEAEGLSDRHEHPLASYNAADLELFSENQTIVLTFDPYEALFSTADQLLEEIEYEDRQPFIFQLYIEVCKALMLESSNWTHLNLAADFHVTARDYEMCDEADYLKKLLPKKAVNKIKQKLQAYDKKNNEEYANDETILNVQAVIEQETGRYEELIEAIEMDACVDIFTQQEIYFIQPYYVEIHMHKRSENIDWELSKQKPENLLFYYQYKLKNNIPQLVDYYHEDKLIWRRIFQDKEGVKTAYKFFLKSGQPEFESYTVLKPVTEHSDQYEKYSEGHYNEITYYKNEQQQIIRAVYLHCMFFMGHKSDAGFEYTFEYKNNELFKISSLNQHGKQTVSYCKDNSFMEETIDAFIEHICTFTLMKMNGRSLDKLDAVVLEYDHSMAFYFTIHLVQHRQLVNISTYEQYEDDSALMNLTVYTSKSTTSPLWEYFSGAQAENYVNETYTRLCSALSERIAAAFDMSVPVVCKYIYDELNL
ncbi:hypothetical protein CHU_2370 [Cytophaga hutchinsonii ATCC 33406]|uniref:Uncharacterized protein n=2 Tax=Cytophaga hutchinsonii TaxID=985 RepID=A0A6N4ST58_CYTH3|nr:hypothetical protein CHU_2370 [Cytophaga hutchinsonii ATCC 33406]